MLPVLHGRVAHDALEDAMKLRITSKACFQSSIEYGLSLSGSVDLDEPLYPLAVAVVHQGKAGLLLEETAQASRTQSGAMGQFVQSEPIGGVADEACGTFDCGMQVAY